jgi:formylglycine-generating enzyme required for sulfatase activity
MRLLLGLAIAVWGLLAGLEGVAIAEPGKRVALVIGNADYRIGRLANPVSDAEAVAAALKGQLKFDTVILHRNLTLDAFRAALRQMAAESAGAALGVIYFAGHGIEVGGRNYLVPIDAGLETARDVKLEAIELDSVLEHLDGVTKLRLAILDACRTNPFPAARRGATRGLGRIEPVGGTLVAYAAKDGTTAEDGTGGSHSPFTASLLKRLVMPGIDVRRVFGYVSEDVLAATGRMQEPYLYGRLGGDEVHLVAAAEAKPGVPVAPPASEAKEAWDAVKDSTILAQFEAVVRRFPGTVYADFATARIEALKKQQTAVMAPPPKAPEPVVAALDPKRASVPLSAAEERALKPKDSFKECAQCPEMVVVPSGSFTMGSYEADSEKPPHKVAIERPFAVGKYEVTGFEWGACFAEGGCEDDAKGRHPVVNVSWHDAKAFAAWLSRKTGKRYRLLSEAEWEYVARAGTKSRFAFGNAIKKNQAQFRAGELGERWGTVEVGSFPANRFGLHDLHGHVYEWVEDTWYPNYQGAPIDGSVWQGGDQSKRVMRGGAWNDVAAHVRSSYRHYGAPDGRHINVGFRIARTL